MANTSYIELDVWKEARRLAGVVYELTGIFPKEEQFSITGQIRRAAISVPSNIAEGCGRNTNKDTIHFLHIARGSLYEVESLIYLSYDQKYLQQENLDSILEQITTCKKLLNGFINYYEKK